MSSELEIGNLQFIFVPLFLYKTGIVNVFKDKNNKTLLETLEHPRYCKLKQNVLINYRQHLNKPLGKFLFELMLKNDNFYKEFLNPYGDETYSKFKIKDHLSAKGLYAFFHETQIVYIGRTHDTFGKRINFGYGNISPKNCYLDGQATNCHLNALITKNWAKVRLYVCQIANDIEIDILERRLINHYHPLWNIALKN